MRAFLAIDLPGSIRVGLRDVAAHLRERYGGWRWIRPEGVHLTLRFLGDIEPADLELHAAVWEAVMARAVPLTIPVGGVGVFPPRGRPRILWVGVGGARPAGALASLARDLERAACELGFRSESRPFRPHLAIARALRHEPAVAPPADAVNDVGTVDAREVVLFRSELRPEGARYHAVRAFPLAGR